MYWRAMILVPVIGTMAFWSGGQVERHGSPHTGMATSRQTDGVADPGQLTIQRKDGTYGQLCPLTRTSVKADVAGFGAHVSVTQVFHNPTRESIEAIYTFPLPNNAAVDHMTMRIGNRVIEGRIKEKNEARRIYEVAKNQGQAAALLDQERPNIFTQRVANITPGAEVDIEIQYVQTLKYQGGSFEFNFPMTVGPRFLGNAPDPHKISPPIARPGTRTGANIDLSVNIDAGAPVESMKSVLHQITTTQVDKSHYKVILTKEDEIPNRDFILRYQVAKNSLSDVFVGHMDAERGGFFGLAVLPPMTITPEDVTPREFIFVIDRSGSQQGFPIEKSRELALKLVDTMRAKDTFNIISFADDTTTLWPAPRPNTPSNLEAAKTFLKGVQAGGGTQLREGLLASLNQKRDPEKLRIIVFNTDGFIGDESQVLDTIQKNRSNVRLFTFGIGNSVNRYLIDAMSAEGRGEAEYVTLSEEADGAVQRFVKRMRTPVLTDVSVKINGQKVSEVEPPYAPDVFDQSPVYVFGRYQTPGPATVTISGNHGGEPWSKTMHVTLPMVDRHPQIMSMWARNRVDSLTRENYTGQFSDNGKDLRAAITDAALEFGIMSDYTSFVAVEDRIVNIGGRQRRVHVPIEMADGVSLGNDKEDLMSIKVSSAAMLAVPAQSGSAGGGGGGAGIVAGRTNAPAGVISGGGRSKGLNGMQLQKQRVSDKRAEPPKPKPEDKLAKKLRTAKGKVEVQIWLSSMTPADLEALKKAGATIEDKDAKLVVVFATADAAKLLEIAKLEIVQRIEPLED